MKRLFSYPLLIPIFSFLALQLQGQEVVPLVPPPSIAVHLAFPSGKALDLQSAEGRFELVEAASGESVQVAATFPTVIAGQEVTVERLDGGQVTLAEGESLTVSTEGKISFTFAPGTSPGSYRLSLTQAGEHWLMEFLVPNPANPGGDPGALQPEAEPKPTPAE